MTEDFAPFDVDVTTEAPNAGELIKSGSGDDAWGIRVVIGGSSNDWYGNSAGGVAYYNSFNYSTDTPTFVFEAQLGNGNEKYTAEAISHEVGHSLGLGHDGTSGTTYYSGQGSGETGWAPILGNGYTKNLTQWSRGEYSGANNTQDDLAMITGNNGFGYRVDDYGDTISQADLLTMNGSVVDLAGIIETNNDFDVFSFTTDGGLLDLSIDGTVRGQNIDIMASLYNSVGSLIVSSNPTNLLDAAISTTVAAGEYFLEVTGVGKGDPGGTGYSDYGSLGQYFVSGTITPASYDTVSISAANAVQSEGDSGTTDFTFTVTRADNTGVATSVNYSVAGSGSNAATADDFFGGVLPSGVINFAAGQTSQTITLKVNGDLDVESDEQFTVSLTNAAGGTEIGTRSASGTIISDDVPPTPGITVTPTSGLTTSELGTTASFTVVLDSRPTDDVYINVTSLDTSEGTVSTNQLTFNSDNWASAQSVVVTGADDAVSDGNVTYQVRLAAASSNDSSYNGLNAANVQVTNQDNEPVPDVVSVTATNSVRAEGDSGTTNFTFTLTRTGNTAVQTAVDYSVAGTGGNAANASDFANGVLPAGTVTFAAGETSKMITIQVAGDTDFEADEQFTVTLSNSGGAANASTVTQIDVATANGTILADDAAPADPGVTVTPTSGLTTRESGNTASFTVVLDSKPTDDVVIDLTSLDTSEGSLNKSQLTFTANNWNQAQSVVVTGVDDSVRDGNVTYQVQLEAASSGDSRYDGFDADDVEVTNQDNEKGKPGGGGGKGRGKKAPAVNESETVADPGDAGDIASEVDDYFSNVQSNGRGHGTERALAALAEVMLRRGPDSVEFPIATLESLVNGRSDDSQEEE